jgi:hypothetical protein
MFDDLRKSDDGNSSFFDEDQADLEPLLEKKPQKQALGISFNSRTFLGMNGFQRFVISALLFVVVCVLGVAFLIVSGSISVF